MCQCSTYSLNNSVIQFIQTELVISGWLCEVMAFCKALGMLEMV